MTRPSTQLPAKPEPAGLKLRRPSAADGPVMASLVHSCPPLDPNSTYAYLLLARDFANTCVVAEAADGVAGMVTGFRPPERPDVLFIWQIAVATSWRGHGLAQAMLDHLLERPDLRTVRFIETTIGPDNAASQRVFRALATRRGLDLQVSPLFAAALFPVGHEAEFLHRLGPITPAMAALGAN